MKQNKTLNISMSDLNLEWMAENFGSQKLSFFNIGCADITDDTFRFHVAMPLAKIYSFECADFWKNSNTDKSSFFNFHYEHIAVSFFDGHGTFVDGKDDNADTNDSIKVWNYTGKLANISRQSLDERSTPVISLNTFCDQNCVKPDFLHIDTEGEEYNILKFLRSDLFPFGIWLENWDFYRNEHDDSVTFATLDEMMHTRSYTKTYAGRHDTLYLQSHIVTTPYREYQHPLGVPWDPNVTINSHEHMIQQQIWLKRYALCKDASWPELKSPAEFFLLPDTIQQQCHADFNLVPSNIIL